MKTIGILGGMSAESTALYYQRLNHLARTHLGDLHSAQILLRSLDFAPIAAMQAQGDWDGMGKILNAEAHALQKGGADLLILATNTMHKLADQITDGLSIPFLHIADATAQAITARGHSRPGLMATAYTMEQDFYTGRLRSDGLDPLIPNAEDRAETHRIIYDELCQGRKTEPSLKTYESIAQRLVDAGADCLILGCTEVGMLLNETNVPVPVFDTTLIHCDTAFALASRD